jgi:hypothetical protein
MILVCCTRDLVSLKSSEKLGLLEHCAKTDWFHVYLTVHVGGRRNDLHGKKTTMNHLGPCSRNCFEYLMTQTDQNWETARDSRDSKISNKWCDQNEGGKVCG